MFCTWRKKLIRNLIKITIKLLLRKNKGDIWHHHHLRMIGTISSLRITDTISSLNEQSLSACCRIKILHQQVLIIGLKLVTLVSLVLVSIGILPLTRTRRAFLNLLLIFIILYNHLPFLIHYLIYNLKMLCWLPWDYFGIQAFWLPHRTFQGRRTLVAHIPNFAESPPFSDWYLISNLKML